MDVVIHSMRIFKNYIVFIDTFMYMIEDNLNLY